jgi:hypothetical protein
MPHVEYKVDGETWPSATQLTSLLPQDWLWSWYRSKVKKHGWRGWQWCKAYSNRAMRLGTHTHSLVEAELKHQPEPACWLLDTSETLNIREPERRIKLVRAWAKALLGTTTRHVVKELELKVIDASRKEHGTIDVLAVEDDGLKFFPKDWKTSGQISIDYPIQLAIYNRCLEAQGYQMMGYGEIERVDKDLKSAKARANGEHHVQVKRFDNLAKYYPVIDALHVIWNYVNRIGDFKSA